MSRMNENTLQLYHLGFECYDDVGCAIFKVEAHEHDMCTLTLNTIVTPETWGEIALKVNEAITTVVGMNQENQSGP